MNVPNSLTFARILITPLFLVVASLGYDYVNYYAVFIFLVGAVTDSLDGYLARKHNQVTKLGEFMDPLADKILISAALIILVEWGRLPGWIAVLLIGREFAVTSLRAVVAIEGEMLAVSALGKFKTVLQIVAVTALFIENDLYALLPLPLTDIALALAVLFTIWSGVDYFIRVWKKLSRSTWLRT